MFSVFLLLCGALGINAYWYPDSSTRTPSPEEGCYSSNWAPAWATCPHSADLLIVPCKNLWIPSAPNLRNNFTYYSVCNYPYSDYVDTGFWSDIITVGVCENFWDACISDNPIAKYNDSIVYGNKTCRAVTDSACGPNRIVASSIPGSQPDDTTLGAFDLGPYSTVSQPTAALVYATSTQSPIHITSLPSISKLENGGGVGTTSQAGSASTIPSLISSSTRSSATSTSVSSPATPTPSKNAARAIAVSPMSSRTMRGILGLILLCLSTE